MIPGLALGVLIGVITGTVFLLILKTADRASDKGTSSILTLTTELLAIPTFWFGGPWLTSRMLALVPLPELINPYLVSLAACRRAIFSERKISHLQGACSQSAPVSC